MGRRKIPYRAKIMIVTLSLRGYSEDRILLEVNKIFKHREITLKDIENVLYLYSRGY